MQVALLRSLYAWQVFPLASIFSITATFSLLACHGKLDDMVCFNKNSCFKFHVLLNSYNY